MTYKVYIHTFPNGKRYIGLCKGSEKKRWGIGGKKYANHPIMNAAIQKYGWDNIQHEVVATGLTQQEAMKMEETLIAQYKTFPPSLGFGYNCTSGGESRLPSDEERATRSKKSLEWWSNPQNKEKWVRNRTGKKKNLTDEQRKEIGRRLSEFNRGKPLSDEHKMKISESAKGHKPWNTGIKMPEEYCKKLSEIQKKIDHTHSEYQDKMILEACRKPVICVETGVVYYSQREAAMLTNTNEGKISEVLKGSRKTAGGYHWKRAEKGV